MFFLPLRLPLHLALDSWVQDFVNYQPPYDDKDKGPRRKGGLNILMEYFTSLDDETR